VVLTAIALPFTLVKQPAGHVNPQFLNLTGRTVSQINSAVSNAFNKFTHDYLSNLSAYQKAVVLPGANSSALFERFAAKVTVSFSQLSSALNSVSHKVPFGGINLNPYLQNLIVGAPTGTTTSGTVTTPSLATTLNTLGTSASASAVKSAISTTQALVSTDINDFINLGVTNNDFYLTRGAKLPPLS
jgi:hypothetical protein